MAFPKQSLSLVHLKMAPDIILLFIGFPLASHQISLIITFTKFGSVSDNRTQFEFNKEKKTKIISIITMVTAAQKSR